MSLSQRTSSIVLRFRDNDGAESTCQGNLPAFVAPGSALSFASAWVPLIQALSAAELIEYEVVLHWHDSSPGSPDVGSDIDTLGTFIFDVVSLDQTTIRVPALDPSFLLTTGPFAGIGIDTSISTVSALITALVDGISGTEPCDPFASDITAINVAYIEQV